MEKTMDKVQGMGEDIYGGARGGDGRLLSTYDAEDVQREGERIARAYLLQRGYELIDTNWVSPMGTFAVAAKDSDEPDGTRGGVVLVEVDGGIKFGADPSELPDLEVGKARLRRLKSASLLYLAVHPELTSVRADVIALNIIGDHEARVRHLVGAFHYGQ